MKTRTQDLKSTIEDGENRTFLNIKQTLRAIFKDYLSEHSKDPNQSNLAIKLKESIGLRRFYPNATDEHHRAFKDLLISLRNFSAKKTNILNNFDVRCDLLQRYMLNTQFFLYNCLDEDFRYHLVRVICYLDRNTYIDTRYVSTLCKVIDKRYWDNQDEFRNRNRTLVSSIRILCANYNPDDFGTYFNQNVYMIIMRICTKYTRDDNIEIIYAHRPLLDKLYQTKNLRVPVTCLIDHAWKRNGLNLSTNKGSMSCVFDILQDLAIYNENLVRELSKEKNSSIITACLEFFYSSWNKLYSLDEQARSLFMSQCILRNIKEAYAKDGSVGNYLTEVLEAALAPLENQVFETDGAAINNADKVSVIKEEEEEEEEVEQGRARNINARLRFFNGIESSRKKPRAFSDEDANIDTMDEDVIRYSRKY